MSAAAGTDTKPCDTTTKDVTCEYCDKPVRECMCCAPQYYDCGRDRMFCAEGVCSGCRAKSHECVCGTCRTCGLRSDKCVCPCDTCKYPGDKCRCDEEREPHPDSLCCAFCYSDPTNLRPQVYGAKPSPRTPYAGMDPCECEAVAKQRDLNAAKDYDCPRCGESAKYCRCKRSHYDGDDE